MDFRQRIGIDVGRKLAVEDAIPWAIENGVAHIDCQIDIQPNELERFDAAHCREIRAACEEAGVKLALHTLSAVNVAEVSPFLRDAADAYLRAYVDAAAAMGAEWIVVHGGYHFSSDKDRRMAAAIERLARAADYAEEKGALLLLENLNWEPDLAEVHYLAHTVEECRAYFDAIPSPALGWSFTVNHATLVPEGIPGFLAGLPTDRLREVRLADNNGEYELHMFPGDGIIDFADLFRRVERTGFRGTYTCAFGSLDDMLRGREKLAEMAPT